MFPVIVITMLGTSAGFAAKDGQQALRPPACRHRPLFEGSPGRVS
jgi:hypothetical protein